MIGERSNLDMSYFFNKIKDLELEHIKILEWYYAARYTSSGRVGSSYDDEKRKNFPIISEHYQALETDLQKYGFLNFVNVSPDQIHRYALSPLGLLLFEYLSSGEEKS